MMFRMARKQALIGVCYDGVCRVPEHQRPPQDVMETWSRLTEKLAALSPDKALCEITVVGTNAMAAANMMKGAPGVRGATGENAVAVCARRADIIAGPIGIVLADAMLGEITPAMACALSSADAVRVLIPMNRTQCENIIVGVKEEEAE